MAAGLENGEKPSKTDALWIWQSDEGYKKIQYFLNPWYPLPRYLLTTADICTYDNKIYNTADVARAIKDAMKPGTREETYYRGGSRDFIRRIIRTYPNFISVSSDREQAESFIDGECCIYELIIDPAVKRVETGVEKEFLLQDNIIGEHVEEETRDGMKVIKIKITVSNSVSETVVKQKKSNNKSPSPKLEIPSLEERIANAISQYKTDLDMDPDDVDDLINMGYLLLDDDEKENAKENFEKVQMGGRKRGRNARTLKLHKSRKPRKRQSKRKPRKRRIKHKRSKKKD